MIRLLLILSLLLYSTNAPAASQSIWGATDRSPAAGTMRLPVDTSSSSSPGMLPLTAVASYVFTTNTIISNIAALTDPNADRILFWDDSAGAVDWLTVGTGLNLTGTTLTSTITQYTDENAQDAIGAMVNTSLTYTDGTPLLALTSRTIGGVAFDGTGNIVPQTIQMVDAAGDTTTFPLLATSATGSLQPATDTGLAYNATTHALTATTFTGALSGNSTTATALAANGGNCSAGNYPLGVDASGATENCTAAFAGPGSSTDTALARWSGTGGATLQDSAVLLSSSLLYPGASDGVGLGDGTHMWSDLFVASGAIVNWNNSDVLLTHSSNKLAFTGASAGYTFDQSIVLNSTARLATAGITGELQVLGTDDNTSTAALARFETTDSAHGSLVFFKSGNNTIGSATVVAADEALGEIDWAGSQQTGTFATQNIAASIKGFIDGTVTSGAGADMPGRLEFYVTPDGSGTPVKQLTIASTGAITAVGAITAAGFTGNVTGNVTGSSGSTTGNAATATALAANGANCSAGQYPLGVDASGAVENCTTAVGDPLSGFLANKNASNQNFTTATATKLTFGTEDFDIANEFASSTYTIASSGKYTISASAHITAVGVGTTALKLHLYKNGSLYKTLMTVTALSGLSDITLHGGVFTSASANDTFEVYVEFTGLASGTATVDGTASASWFSGLRDVQGTSGGSTSFMDYRAITNTDTVGTGDIGSTIEISGSTNFTLAFTASATLGDKAWGIIQNDGSGNVTLDPNGAETIDGAASWILYPGGSILWKTDSTAFYSTLIKPMVATFNSTANFTIPGAGTYFDAELWGGGASGGRAGNGDGGGGGGGGGYLPFKGHLLSEIGSVGGTSSISVAASATAQTVDDTDGLAGNNSSIGLTGPDPTAFGGGKGNGDSTTSTGNGGGGGAGTGSVGSGPATNGGAAGPRASETGTAGGTAANPGNPGTNGSFDGGSGGGGGTAGAGGLGGCSAYGGGGGGGGSDATTGGNGGCSLMAGGGGAGGGDTAGGTTGGASKYAGNGGGGATGAATATDGTAPSGGGGGSETGNSGAGAVGKVIIYIY